MNERFTLTTLSTHLPQGKSKNDNHINFDGIREASNFLVRRRLLAIENHSIQNSFAEIDGEIKARQDHLVVFRDRVLGSLRDHLAQREKAQREELTLRENLERREKVKNLPKTAERYVRRKGKLACLKLGSAPDTDDSDAVGAQGPSWRLPKAVEVNAWADWFIESNFPSREASRLRKDRIQVALVVGGGLGDLLKSTHLVGPISDHFSCDLTIIADQSAVGEVVARNPYVKDSFVPISHHVFNLVDSIKYISVFDLIMVWTYNVQYIIPPGSRLSCNDIESIESQSSDLRRMLEKYCFLHGWPVFNFAYSRDVTRLGLSVMKVGVATSGLPHRNPNEIPFFPGKESLRAISGFLTKPYVTVHHGFDLKHLPVRTRETDYNSTKNLSMEQWREIVSLVRKEGVEVVQLGIVEEEKIAGVTHYLNGLTSIEETGLLIKHGLCHIDTEGGLVHLANAVHGRCVVVFGPTPVEFFGYPQNINLEPAGCKGCWFATKSWVIECPRQTDGPECMRGHSAISVADAARRIIAETENLSAKLIAAETQFYATPFAETIATAQRLQGDDAADRTLLILDDLPRDVGSALSDSVLDGSDVIVCADQPAEMELNDRIAGRFEHGSLLNLARGSSSIDAVVWATSELDPDIAPFALREIFRVLKPGGELLFAALGQSTGLDLRRSLLAGGIAFNEHETPSAPVYSCCLRKNGAQAEYVSARTGTAVSLGSLAPTQVYGHAVDPRLALLEEENRRQITLVRDMFVERQELIDEVAAIVDDAVQRGFGGDGWIWISNLFAEGYPTRFFMSGWETALDWVIWSRDDKCLLMLPFGEHLPLRGGRLELQLHLTCPGASTANPITIGVRVDDGPVENFRLSTDDEILTILAPTDYSKFRGVSLVELHLGAERRQGACGRSTVNSRMGVRRFRYRLLSSQMNNVQLGDGVRGVDTLHRCVDA